MTEARWALTALLLVLLYQRQIRDSRPLFRQNGATLLVLTLCGQVSFPLTLYIGLQSTSALNAAIYMSATPCMVLMINRLIFHDRVSARNWWGVIFSTAGVLLLLLHGNLSNAEGLKGFSQGDLWAMGSALSWAVYCSLLRNKDFLAVAAPRHLIRRLPRYRVPYWTGVSGDFPLVAGLPVLE